MRRLVVVLTACCVVFSLLIGAGQAKADFIVGLYNTGVSDTGSVLPDSSVDPHYTLISVPTGSGLGPAAYVVDSSKFPIASGDWMADSSTSKWIGPTADQSTFTDAGHTGLYVYRTIFDLTGFDPSTTVITGQWSTDNFGEDILINGISTGFTHTDGSISSFKYFTSFTITSGFRSGLNTLDFVVDNAPLGYPGGVYNPTGLRVEMVGTATPVPEPSALTLVGTGLIGLIGYGWWQRRYRRLAVH
jgi:hypothetical protein